MLTSEEREQIRRAYYLDHKIVRHISVEQGHSRDTINRIVTENPPTSSRRTRGKPASVYGPFLPRIDALMEQNERLPQKQRYKEKCQPFKECITQDFLKIVQIQVQNGEEDAQFECSC